MCAVSSRAVRAVLPHCSLFLGSVLQAASFRLSAERVFTPLVTLAIIIQRYPDVSQ
jgi:hypothetical protein